MNQYENILKFQGLWRNYQQRILEHADSYLADGKIHIVAAPGSGKTTLGIELINRIGEPCLILSPSLIIRNQWIDRIRQAFFIDKDSGEEYLSNDIRNPSLITSITYQALHSAISNFKGSMEEDDELTDVDYSDFDLFQTLEKMGIRTLCLDECHHLRSEWWKALETLRKQRPLMKLISLTATPPYDSTPAEWTRYVELCGEIDEEIQVPELVKEGSLCPHQDFVLFNYPSAEEQRAVADFKNRAKNYVKSLMEDENFAKIISTHQGLKDPENWADRFLDKPAYLSSLLIFMQEKKISYPSYLSRLIGTKRLPAMSIEWMEYLLQGFLYDDFESYYCDQVYREQLIKELKSKELIVRNQVELQANEKIKKMLITSKGKIKSIEIIAEHEAKSMGKELRLLILTDYIKKEYIKSIGYSKQAVDALGVIPFFEMLRRKQLREQKLGVLCGSIVIIPQEATEILQNAVQVASVGGQRLAFKSLKDEQEKDTGYVMLEVKGKNKALTAAVTALFEQGYINILIGTKALLGEGWDSPAVNSLIMASFVGAFMLSNQMRGRAIRTMAGNPHKTSNIWHLVCVNKDDGETSPDYETLTRRMDHFLGVHDTENTIESGISRLSVIEQPFNRSNINKINRKMLDSSTKRDNLEKRWQEALMILDQAEVEEECQIEKDKFRLSAEFINIFGIFLASLVVDIILISIANGSRGSLVASALSLFLTIVVSNRVVVYVVKLANLVSPWKLTKKIGECIQKELQNQGMIQTQDVCVRVDNTEDIIQHVYLKGGTAREKAMFAKAIMEFYEPVDNQRYLLVKGTKRNYSSYFNVPEVFSKRQEDAVSFAGEVRKVIGKCKVVYTRNPNGRKILIEARVKAFANRTERYIDRKKTVKSRLK